MPTSCFAIHPASRDPADEAGAAAVDALCFPLPTLDFAAEMQRPWARIWVARTSELRVVGFLVAWLVADELHILSLATEPAYQKRGIGRALLDTALAHARDRRVRSILLEVRRSNQAAIRLYRAVGFSATGVRPHYYADNLEDAIEMLLALDPSTGEVQKRRDEMELEEVAR